MKREHEKLICRLDGYKVSLKNSETKLEEDEVKFQGLVQNLKKIVSIIEILRLKLKSKHLYTKEIIYKIPHLDVQGCCPPR